jgi:hypothetical protein
MKTTRIAPGIYSLSHNGTDYWVEGLKENNGLWLVHDLTSDEYWFNYFPSKRAAVAAIVGA